MAEHLSNKEKAERYDALQVAIKFRLELYVKRRDDFNKQYREAQEMGVIGSYTKGQSDAFALVVDDLRRLVE